MALVHSTCYTCAGLSPSRSSGTAHPAGILPAGPISSRWQLGQDVFRITVEAPDGTSGTVAVPTLGAPRVIYRDGGEVWNGTAAVTGAIATATADVYVEFAGVTGSHTWAWS